MFAEVWSQWCQYLGPVDNMDLAEICEVSPAAVTGWLNGSRLPRKNKLRPIVLFIHELLEQQCYVVRPHNRRDFVTLQAIYKHHGPVPSPTAILETFTHGVSVDSILNPNDDRTNGVASANIKPQRITLLTGGMLAALSMAIVVGLVFYFVNFTSSIDHVFTHNKPVLSLTGRTSGLKYSPTTNVGAFLWQPDGSTSRDVYIQRENGQVTQITDTPEIEIALDWSPDEKRLAVMRVDEVKRRCRIVLIDLIKNIEQDLTECGANIMPQLIWSRDGNNLYFIGRENFISPYVIIVYNFASKQQQILTQPPKSTLFGDYAIVESPSGSGIAYLRSDRWSVSQLRVLDLKAGTDELLYQFDQIIHRIAWNFNDREVLAVTGPIFNHIDVIAGKQQKHLLLTRSRPITEIQTQDKSRSLIVQETIRTEDIFLSQPDNQFGAAEAINITNTLHKDWQPNLAPNQQQLAFLSNRNGETQLWLSLPNGGSAEPVNTSHLPPIVQMRWSPDSQKLILATNDNRLHALTLANGQINRFSPSDMVAKNPSWGADSERVYFTSDQSGEWEIWLQENVRTEPRQITIGGGFSAHESSDGQTLLFTQLKQYGIWQIPLHNRDLENANFLKPVQVVKHLIIGAWNQWQVRDNFLYYASTIDGGFQIFQHDLTGQNTKPLHFLPHQTHFDFSFFVPQEDSKIYISRVTDTKGEYIKVY